MLFALDTFFRLQVARIRIRPTKYAAKAQSNLEHLGSVIRRGLLGSSGSFWSHASALQLNGYLQILLLNA